MPRVCYFLAALGVTLAAAVYGLTYDVDFVNKVLDGFGRAG